MFDPVLLICTLFFFQSLLAFFAFFPAVAHIGSAISRFHSLVSLNLTWSIKTRDHSGATTEPSP